MSSHPLQLLIGDNHICHCSLLSTLWTRMRPYQSSITCPLRSSAGLSSTTSGGVSHLQLRWVVSSSARHVPSCSVVVELLVMSRKRPVWTCGRIDPGASEGQTPNEDALMANIHLLIGHLSDWLISCLCTYARTFVADSNSLTPADLCLHSHPIINHQSSIHGFIWSVAC